MKIILIIFCCLFVSHQLWSQEISNDVFEIFPVLDFKQSRDMPKDGYEKLDYAFETTSGKILHENIWFESRDVLKKKGTYIDFSDVKDVYMFYSQGNADPVFCNINQLHLPDEEGIMLVFEEGGAKKLSSMTSACPLRVAIVSQGKLVSAPLLMCELNNNVKLTLATSAATRKLKKDFDQLINDRDQRRGGSSNERLPDVRSPNFSMNELLEAANNGYVYPQFELAVRYLKGTGVPRNDQEALRWFQKAAEQGHSVAQNVLGHYYKNGLGTMACEDKGMALKWWNKSAQQGNVDSQYNLGICYEDGYGVEANAGLAAQWFLKSATRGYSPSQNRLGLCYEHGIGVPTNIKKALAWYKKAARQGNPEAKKNLERCLATDHGTKNTK